MFANVCAGIVAGYLLSAFFAKLMEAPDTLAGFRKNGWNPAWALFVLLEVVELVATVLMITSNGVGRYSAAILLTVYVATELFLAAKRPGTICYCFGTASSPSSLKSVFTTAAMLSVSVVGTGASGHVIVRAGATLVATVFSLLLWSQMRESMLFDEDMERAKKLDEKIRSAQPF